MRGEVWNKERWKRRRAPSQDSSTYVNEEGRARRAHADGVARGVDGQVVVRVVDGGRGGQQVVAVSTLVVDRLRGHTRRAVGTRMSTRILGVNTMRGRGE